MRLEGGGCGNPNVSRLKLHQMRESRIVGASGRSPLQQLRSPEFKNVTHLELRKNSELETR